MGRMPRFPNVWHAPCAGDLLAAMELPVVSLALVVISLKCCACTCLVRLTNCDMVLGLAAVMEDLRRTVPRASGIKTASMLPTSTVAK